MVPMCRSERAEDTITGSLGAAVAGRGETRPKGEGRDDWGQWKLRAVRVVLSPRRVWGSADVMVMFPFGKGKEEEEWSLGL